MAAVLPPSRSGRVRAIGKNPPPPMPPGLPEDAFGAVFADLWQAAITDGPPTRCEFIHTALATQMAFACHESARIRQRVALPLKTQYAPLELGHHPPDTGAWEGAILLIADMHHVDANTGLSARDGLLAALSGLGHRVRWFDPTERDPEQSDFDGIDLLMLYHTQRTASEATRTLLGDWFQSGKPVVVSHCGIGAYDDWEAYRRWIGLYWVWGDDRTAPAGIRPSDHPHLPSTITVTAPRFAVPWRSAWIPADEVYHNLGQMAEVEILATADCGQDAQPAAWQVVNHRNVVGWLPGHRPDIWDLPVVREGLQAAIGLAIQSSVPASK